LLLEVDLLSAPFALANILLVLGVLVLGLSAWLRNRWESNLVNARDAKRLARTVLAGLALVLSGTTVLLAEVMLPVAIVLMALIATWLVMCMRPAPRRIHVESETVFRCTPEKAYDLLAEPRKEPLFRSETERVEVLSVGTLAVGTVVRGWVRLPRDSGTPGIYLVAEEVITEYDPPRIYATRVVGQPSQTRLTFDAVANATRVIADYQSTIGFAEAVTGGVFSRGEVERRILRLRQEGWERARAILEEPAA
jgi:hypothetical protein